MSGEGSRSGSKTPPRKRTYPLKMETIPMSSSYSELKDAGIGEMGYSGEAMSKSHQNRHTEEEDYAPIDQNVSSYEADDDFKFKRHKTKPMNGVPSLGERLDNLQDMKNAKWVDNFNSSMPMNSQQRSKPDIRPPSMPPSQANQYSQTSQIQQQPAYMPYMYYYPMPTPGHPLMSYMGSPVHPSQLNGTQYMNSSVSMLPNTSLQPFMPPPPVPNHKGEQNSAPQLLPPPSLYPYNFLQQQQQHQQQQQYAQKAKNKSQSSGFNRGRRLSMLASQEDHNMIVSPHKDVPEEDFYRHVGNTSFGRGLQIRQLFNWCVIRSLRKMGNQENEEQAKSEMKEGAYVNPKKIAIVIIEEFVNDLRKGAVNIDWEEEESGSGEEFSDAEDTELRNLFDDDDDDDEVNNNGLNNKNNALKKNSSKKSRNKKNTTKRRNRIANSKNVANEKNLESLQGRIDAIEREIVDWTRVLNDCEVDTEWKQLSKKSTAPPEKTQPLHEEPSIEDIRENITEKMNKLYIHSHLLNSGSEALSQLTGVKLDKLSRKFVPTVHDQNANARSNTQTLLKGLSKSLLE